jgi:hypothetical protein
MKPSMLNKIFVCSSFLSIVALNQGCSGGFTSVKNREPASSASVFVEGPGGTMVPAAAIKTSTVTHAGNLLDHISAMHGIDTPSAAARTAYNDNRLRMSETGKVDTVTAPMWLAITNLSGRSCNDLIAKEAALPDAQRSFFGGVDFTKGPDALKAASASLDSVVHKFARAVWARDEDAAELDLIKSATAAQFSGTSTTATRNMVKFICSAMTASLDAQDF